MSERGTETQCLREKLIDRLRSDRVVTLLLSLLGWGEGEGEKDVSRVCAVGIEAQLASVCVYVCVCLKEESIDYYQDRCATLLLRCRVVCVCVCLREKPVDRLVSRSRCHPTPSVLGSVCVWLCGCVCVGGALTLTYPYSYKKQSW